MLGVDSFNYGKDFDGEKPETLLLCSYKFTHKHTQGFSKLYIQKLFSIRFIELYVLQPPKHPLITKPQSYLSIDNIPHTYILYTQYHHPIRLLTFPGFPLITLIKGIFPTLKLTHLLDKRTLCYSLKKENRTNI